MSKDKGRLGREVLETGEDLLRTHTLAVKKKAQKRKKKKESDTKKKQSVMVGWSGRINS